MMSYDAIIILWVLLVDYKSELVSGCVSVRIPN